MLSIVQFYRPDIIEQRSPFPLIPLNPPPNPKGYCFLIFFFIILFVLFYLLILKKNTVGNVPNVGELMLASFPHSATFHQTIAPKNSW